MSELVKSHTRSYKEMKANLPKKPLSVGPFLMLFAVLKSVNSTPNTPNIFLPSPLSHEFPQKIAIPHHHLFLFPFLFSLSIYISCYSNSLLILFSALLFSFLFCPLSSQPHFDKLIGKTELAI